MMAGVSRKTIRLATPSRGSTTPSRRDRHGGNRMAPSISKALRLPVSDAGSGSFLRYQPMPQLERPPMPAPHVVFGGENQLAIRLDNPPRSSRWHPGGGIYRNVWLTKTAPVHVASGARTSRRATSPPRQPRSTSPSPWPTTPTPMASVRIATQIHPLAADGHAPGGVVATLSPAAPANSRSSRGLSASARRRTIRSFTRSTRRR